MDEMDYVSHNTETVAPVARQASVPGAAGAGVGPGAGVGTGAGAVGGIGQGPTQSAQHSQSQHPYQSQSFNQSQQPQPSGCPYFRGVGAEHHQQPHFPQHPSHLPLPPQHPQFSQQQQVQQQQQQQQHPILNPHQPPTQSHSQPQPQIQHQSFLSQPQNRNNLNHQGVAALTNLLQYDPIHTTNGNWYPALPWSGPAGLPSHPPLLHHHHSRTSSSDTYFNNLSGPPQGLGSAGLGLGSVGIPGVPGLGLLHGQAPQHQLPHEPFAQFFYRHPPPNLHRFPGITPPVSSHNQTQANNNNTNNTNLNQTQSSMNATSSQPGVQQQPSSQSTSRGISLPTPNPPPPPSHFTTNISGSGESSPDLPTNRRSMFGNMADSSRGSNRSENGAPSTDLAPSRPTATSLFGDAEPQRSEAASATRQDQPGVSTPPPASNTERRRAYPTRTLVPMPHAFVPPPPPPPDYDSDDELDQLEDDNQALRFIEQFSMGGNFPRDMGEAQVRAHQILRGQMPNKRVASKKALSQLQSVDIDSLEESERTCVICYNEFGVENPEGINEAPLRLPSCKHIFGDHCIKKWFEESDSCPYCRDKVPSEPIIPSNAQYIRDLYRQFPGRAHTGRGGVPDLNIRIVPHPRGDDSRFESSPPRGWQTGDRRSPPSEASESRRRTRPRHSSFRGSPSTGGSNRHGSSHAGSSSTMTPLQQGPTRERVNPPNRPPWWYASVYNSHRRLTPLSSTQFTSQRPYYHPINSMGRFSMPPMPPMPPSYQPVEPLGLNSPPSMTPQLGAFGSMMNIDGTSSLSNPYQTSILGGPVGAVLSPVGDPLPGPAQLDAYSQQLPSSASLPPVVAADGIGSGSALHRFPRTDDSFFPVSR